MAYPYAKKKSLEATNSQAQTPTATQYKAEPVPRDGIAEARKRAPSWDVVELWDLIRFVAKAAEAEPDHYAIFLPRAGVFAFAILKGGIVELDTELTHYTGHMLELGAMLAEVFKHNYRISPPACGGVE